MLAYSSINHLGYCLLGMFAVAKFDGQRAGFGTDKAAPRSTACSCRCSITASRRRRCSWFVGLLEQRSGGLRGLNDFGGLRKVCAGVLRADGHRAVCVARVAGT